MSTRISKEHVDAWVQGYVRAWKSTDPADIEALFTEDAESYEWPYETAWVGREAIIEGWLGRQGWQDGGWSFDWELLTINGDTFAVKGLGKYRKLGRFDNLWVVTLATDGRCSTFRMWNNEV